MFQKSANTAALSGNSLLGATNWDCKSLEIFAMAKKSTQSGSRFKTTLSCSGDLEIEVSGVSGFDSRETQVKGFNNE